MKRASDRTRRYVSLGLAEPLFTWANVITATRTVVCVAMFAVAARLHSTAWNLCGLCMYWALDLLDGYLARRLDEETRLGAQFDILSDRLAVAFFYMNHLAWHPEIVVPISLFLVQFMLVDQYLSNQFIRFRLLSPNDFHMVEPTIWQLNWSPLAKACNSSLVTLLILFSSSPYPPALAAALLIGLKGYSLVRLFRLREAT
jgi:CDP-diacylglycerol--glycerol-3-phosphate 3-phosphatidyltransferase